MSTNPNGWLPYGSADDSIIFQHPLTSALTPADIADIATTLYIGSATLTWDAYGSVVHGHDVTHHATYGMKAVSSVDGTTECGYRFNGGGTKLDNGGQISFEIEREWLCLLSATNYSSGYNPATNEYPLSTNATTGGAQSLFRKNATTMALVNGVGGATITNYVSSAGKSDFVRVCIGWIGGRVGGPTWLAVSDDSTSNPIVIGTGTRNSATLASLIADFYLGSDRGVANSFVDGYYMRNLQISTRPPMFAVHPLLRHVGMISDSILNSDNNSTGDYKDAVSSWTFRREMAKRGHHCGTVTVTVDGGARLDNSVDGGTTDYIKTQLTTLLALNPTIVIIRGGTNDALNDRCSDATWQASVTDYITDCMAVTSVRRVVFLGIPSAVGSTLLNTVAFKSERTTGETKIQAACDAWRAANPSDTRDVIFADDIYSRLGGESPAAGTFIGQVSRLYTDLHLSGYGQYVHGKAIADWLIQELGTA